MGKKEKNRKQLTYKVTMLAVVLLAHLTLSEILSAIALTSQWMTEWDSRHDQDKNDPMSLLGP